MTALASMSEPIIDPGRRIIDPHHHLFPDPGPNHYPPDALMADLDSGHRVVGTVFVECGVAYAADCDPDLATTGETAYAAAVARSVARPGGPQVAAGSVVAVDLTLAPAKVGRAIALHQQAAAGALRGIRHRLAPPSPAGLMEEPAFLQGFAELYAAGLSFDAWLYFDQLPELCALADRFADTPIIIDHYGSPVPHRRAPADRAELFAVWRRNLCEAARRPNVAIKLGGLGMPLMRLGFDAPGTTASSEQLAAAWQPYFEVALEAFGPARAMFESNYPADRPTADYPMLWNVAKRLAAGLSEGEKDALFSGTAQRIYRLDL